MENVVVLQMAKTNYGTQGQVVLRKNFEQARFEEIARIDKGHYSECEDC